MDNNTTSPALTGPLLFFTQIELVTPTTVAGTFYGVAVTLFSLYVYALAPRLREGDRTRQARFMLAYSTVIMLCGLYSLVANAWVTQDAYIRHSGYPEGPYAYIISTYLTTPVIPIGLVCQAVIDILTLAIQVWRVRVIWSGTRYANLVTVLPVLCLLTLTGLRLRTIVLDAMISFAKDVPLDTITDRVEIAIQGATTVLCTVLISLYLIFKQWQQRKLIGKIHGSTGYTNVVAMIVESYALESIWLLAFVILWEQPIGGFFGESAPYVEIIAYLLVQYRVASGKGHESQREQRNMSSLRWNHSTHITTQHEETGEIRDGPQAPVLPEACEVSRMA